MHIIRILNCDGGEWIVRARVNRYLVVREEGNPGRNYNLRGIHNLLQNEGDSYSYGEDVREDLESYRRGRGRRCGNG